MLLPYRPLGRHVVSKQRHAGQFGSLIAIGQVRQHALDQRLDIGGGSWIGLFLVSQGGAGELLLLGIGGAQAAIGRVQVGKLQSEDEGVALALAADEAAGKGAPEVAEAVAHGKRAPLHLIARIALQRRAPGDESRLDARGDVVGIGEIVGQGGQHRLRCLQPRGDERAEAIGRERLPGRIPRGGRLGTRAFDIVG